MTMVWTFLLVLMLAVVIVVAAKLRRKDHASSVDWPLYPKKVLTPVEQQFYQRLIRAFPNHVVLAQVSYSQLFGVKRGNRVNYQSIVNRFNRLTADFVLCQRDFATVALFELDDRSHDRPARMSADQRKAGICAAAGVALHRINVNPMPNEAELRELTA
jgi:hypothetical protein